MMRLKKLLYKSWIIILLIPLLQFKYKLLKEEPLNGSFSEEQIKIPALQFKSFSNEKFQIAVEKEVKSKYGFKNTLIRINNQVDYSLFDVANAYGIVVAKNNLLLPGGYIKSYLGVDAENYERLEAFVEKARFVQDTLVKLGKKFCFAIAPGKASIYSESIPSYFYKNYEIKESNYEKLVPLLKENKINYIDFRHYISEKKSQFEYPIFPSMGLHWSGNTVAHVTDTLLGYINNDLGLEVQQISLSKGLETTKDYKYTDYDIGESMNLLWYASEERLHYPKVEYSNFNGKKPGMLAIGDSFLQSFYGFYDVFDTVFSDNSRVWFYNRTLNWPQKFHQHNINVKELDLRKELSDKSLIMVETTDENVRMMGFNFIDELYRLYKGKDGIPLGQLNQYQTILNNEETRDKAQKNHKLLGYSIEEMKKSIARYQLQNIPLANINFEEEVQKEISSIKENEGWLELIKKQAVERNITVEENIKLNAEWMVREKLGQN